MSGVKNAASFLCMMGINHTKHSFMSEQNNANTNPKLQEFFVTSLEEMYWAETHLVSVLTTMSRAATDPNLKQAFDLHAEQTQQHRERLEKVFNLLNMTAQAAPSIGLQGLFDEGWQVIDRTEDGTAVRDAALIVAAQKVEHYEIACYGSLITMAKTIGQTEIARILVPTLNEEKDTDAALTAVAEAGINEEAVEEKPKKSAKKSKAQGTEAQEVTQVETAEKPKKSPAKGKAKAKP
jgi:ferritin-like metal-binding protein YciE